MMRTVTYRLDDLKDVVIHIGRAEENLATRVRIDAGKVFAEYPAAVPTMKVINPAGTVYGREVSRDGDLVIWDVTDGDLAAEGQGEMQLTFTENSVIVKSADARTEVCRSIVGGTTPPDPVQDWIDRAEEVLEEVEDAFPEGGTTGQVLAKKSNADFDTEWVDQGSGGTTDYTDLENKPQIGGVTLIGNKSLHDLGAAAESDIPDVSGFYTKPAGGIPASDIAAGVIPDPEDLIDDTAGEGDTDKTWSADKLTSDVLSALHSLAENGYYTESGHVVVNIPVEYGQVMDSASHSPSIDTNHYTGYVFLTSEQEQETIEFDDTTFKYNLVYINNGSVVSETSWTLTSPISINSNITHNQIAVNIRRLDSATLSASELSGTLSYDAEVTVVGNLATKNYAVAKQQSTSDNGKVLGIGADGVVTPVTPSAGVDVDDTLSIEGDAADAKKTGDTIKEIVNNGYYVGGDEKTYVQTSVGMVYENKSIDTTATGTGYVKLTAEQESIPLIFDTTKYKCNLAYFNNNTNTEYTSWITSSPLNIDSSITHTEVYVNVRKLSGTMSADDLSTCLYYMEEAHIGNLATKQYVDKKTTKGLKCIYPDDFSCRIKPDIYFNGSFYADIDIDSFKLPGTGEVWVAKDGNDSTGTGEESKPYATITKALTTTAKTIHIKEGTYEQGTDYSSWVDVKNRNLIGHGTVIFQNDSSGHSTTASENVYVENITFKHGNSSVSNAAFFASCTSSGQTSCFVGCVFCDSGENGLTLTGIDAVLINCVANGNKLDGFNYHAKTSNGSTFIPNVIEINCVGYNNGSAESQNDSCNGSTAHDGVQIIRLNGEYYSCYGGVIAEIGGANEGDPTTKSVNYGVLAHESTVSGDNCASFWASYNTEMYLYDCSCYGGTYDISALNDAKVVSRRLTTGRDEPSVKKSNSATVIQY